jgi:ATP-dependent DNA helicase DinG
MSDLVHASREALSDGGALASHLDAFVPRPAQLHLTEAIADALQQRDLLLAEAGTGTGKTFAYLVPVLLSGLRTIISTGTRALQDQLYHRDLPRVRQALGVGLRSALLKGRANYLCRYRLQQARGEPRFPAPSRRRSSSASWPGPVVRSSVTSPNWKAWPMTRRCCRWSPPPSTTAWVPIARSGMTASWCARQRAQAADVVVVNHHLLLADLALKQDGFGELLPGAQAFVIDEAHQLPELAAQFFGEGFGMRPWQELGRDCLAEARGVAARSRRCRNRSTSCSRRCWRCARRWRGCRRGHAVARWRCHRCAMDSIR